VFVVVLDRDHRCCLINHTEVIQPASEVLGRTPYEYYPPAYRDSTRACVERVFETGKPGSYEVPVISTVDGRERWYECLLGPVFENDKVSAVSLIAINVTARKQTEVAQLRKEHDAIRLLLHAGDRERRLIADEIHDRISQPLAAALLFLDAYERLAEQNPDRARVACENGRRALHRIAADARVLTSGVRSPVFDKYGLEAAIRHLIHDRRQQPGSPQIEFHTEVAVEKLDSVLENVIYRIIQEGITNALRHSGSNTVRVDLVQDGDVIRIVVQDWGLGFDPQQIKPDCAGLEGIRLRARLLGGTAVIDSSPGLGTRLDVTLPIVPEEVWSGLEAAEGG
jgi:signal transduction histidine kinase